MATVNINNTDNQVTAVNANQSIIVTDNGSTSQTSINVTQPVTSVVLVNTLGPVGPQGPQGPSGSGGTINTSSFVTTSSFNAFTGSYNTGSFTGSFTGSLFGTSSWAQSASQALTASYVNPLVQNVQITGAIDVSNGHVNIRDNAYFFQGTATNDDNVSLIGVNTNDIIVIGNQGFDNRIEGDTDIWGGLTVSGSLLVSSSLSTISGSLNVTSGITGSLFGTASRAITASYALNGGTINTSSFATTGSNTFIGNQTITGSVYITGSLNADAQVYEVSFLQKDSPPYPSGDNLIELDQDLIANPNYTRNTNTITVNSSGTYRIYAQCRFEVSSGVQDDAEMAVFINNNPYRAYYIKNIKSSEISTYNFSCIASLNTNDTIEFHINSNTQPFNLYEFSKIYTSVVESYMTIEKLN